MSTERVLDDVIREFLVESQENLDRIDSDLLALEQGSEDPGLLAAIFRGVHTIKGTCGFLGLPQLETVAHRGENLLSLLRDGVLKPRPEIIDALLHTVDAIRAILSHLESTGEEGTHDYAELLQQLEILAKGEIPEKPLGAPNSAAEVAAEPEAAPVPESAPAPEAEAEAPAEAEVPAPEAEAPAVEAEAPAPEAEAPAEEAAAPAEEAEAPQPEPAAAPVAAAPQPAPAPTPVAAAPAPKPAPVAAKPAPSKPAETSMQNNNRKSRPSNASKPAETEHVSVADSTIRVDVGLLDRVMNLVGELVLARNRILQFSAHVEDASFANASQRLNLLTTELQEGVMKTRMQPIGNVWNKLPRMVRDLCQSCGKDVELELDGTETELDRTIIEAIKDPLTHAVRNAIDHGIESGETRTAAGKSPRGRLLLSAFHEGGQVNIEISDDGAGIDLDKVKRRAIDRGLVSPERAKNLSDREIAHFIFHPGFSTAAAVTNVSGRGVGMDVVKTNVEKIGGTVDIASVRGEGTTLKIKIPLTLAIIPALIVTSRGERFAIPQVNLLELVRLEAEQAKSGVERLYGTTLYRLRGELLPLVFLDETLGLTSEHNEPEALNIVVLQADQQQFGLVVDEVRDTEEIVVKPLGKELKTLDAFAGATIMGDGRVALILDVLGIAERASIHADGGSPPFVAEASEEDGAAKTEKQSLLLFEAAEDTRMAVALSLVARLEELDPSTIEWTAGQMVVQYRGAILPLIDLSETFGRGVPKDLGPVDVIVCADDSRAVGLVVREIIDTVEEVVSVRETANRPGTRGAAVIQGRVTDLLDLEAVLSRCDPSLCERKEAV